MVMGYPGYGGEHKPKHAKPEEVAVNSLDENITIKETPTVGKFGVPWKAIYGFVAVFVGQLVARAFVEGVPVIPTNTSGLIALVGGSFIAAVGIWFKANIYTVDQAQANLALAHKKAA